MQKKSGKLSETVCYASDFTKVNCRVHSIDFGENQITIDVPEEVLKDGLHAGILTINFMPLKE